MTANLTWSSSAEMQRQYAGWRVTLACCVAAMAGFGSILIYSFGILLKPLSVEFGWSRGTISTAFACASFTLGIASPFLGMLLDRYGPRRVIVPCVAIFGVAFSSLALLTNSRIQLFTTFVVIGMVGNATAQLGYARVVSTWFRQHRGVALALLMAGAGAGSIFVPVITQTLVGMLGWRSTYAVLGAAPLFVALPLVLLFIREKAAPEGGVSELPLPGSDPGEASRSRAFWLIAVMLFLTAMSTTGTITHLSALLTDRGFSLRQSAWAISFVGVSGICGRLITGWVLDRFFGPPIAMLLLFMTAGGLVTLAGAATFKMAVAGSILIGFSMGGESDVVPYLLARYFGLRRLGTLYGFTWTAYAIAAALGSVLLGRAFDATGSYGALLVKLAVLVFVAGVLMAAMPRYPVQISSPEYEGLPAVKMAS